MTTALTNLIPERGPEYDKADPDSRAAWLAFRANGITATEVRDWGIGSRRREILAAKVSGTVKDIDHLPAVHHGNIREPVIAAWAAERFGITPCDAVYAHAEHPRHLASPDGILLDPFTGELITGPEAFVMEIKTSSHDLTPGLMAPDGTLLRIEPGSPFDRAGYWVQMQWQMYVMNAARTLFVWEQHTGRPDPTLEQVYEVTDAPRFAWIDRDQAAIDVLISSTAEPALAMIDSERSILAESWPLDLTEETDLPDEHALLVADLLAARDAEAVAAAAKDTAWRALTAYYLREEQEDAVIETPLARISVSTSQSVKRTIDEAAMSERAPALVAKYAALREKFTTLTPTSSRRLTITRRD